MSERTMSGLRLGIDVGGTNTDAVILDAADQVLAKAKATTSVDATAGIGRAVRAVLHNSGCPPASISHVMIGTTHATNAILERSKLGRVAVIRVAGPATHMLPPMASWPDDLRESVEAGSIIIPGGAEMDGTDLYPLDVGSLRAFFASLDRFDAVAIVSTFAPVTNRHEVRTRKAVIGLIGQGIPIVLSSEVGSIGLIERENATILNAAMARVAARVTRAVQHSIASRGIDAITYFAQNDGTLMSLDYVRLLPVLTIGSGPANSIRGAAYLSGCDNAIVVDVGGTSADVGVLASGFPRISALPVEIGGVRTNFRMPDLVSMALGGGSVVGGTPDAPVVGPASVGFRIAEAARVFGGAVTTATDAAVAVGKCRIGTHPSPVDMAMARSVMGLAGSMITDAVDRVKLAPGDQPLVAVGGGSFLIPDSLPGVSGVIRPRHHEVANAIGAAIASVSGNIDQIYDVAGVGREAVLSRARADAIRQAVLHGADPEGTEVVDLEELSLQYLPSSRLRIRAKAAGPLAAAATSPDGHVRPREPGGL